MKTNNQKILVLLIVFRPFFYERWDIKKGSAIIAWHTIIIEISHRNVVDLSLGRSTAAYLI